MNVAYDVINQGYYDVIYEKSSKTVTKNALKYFIGGLTLINVYESYYMTNGIFAKGPKIFQGFPGVPRILAAGF